MTLQPGARLGPFEIQSAVGAGGMGEVYRARDTRLDRTVAIKVLPDSLAGDPRFRERFDREARVIASLDHPHICTLYDVGEQDAATGSGHAIAFLVMPYLEGETLADRIARGSGRAGPFGPAEGLPLEEALQIAIQIASGLAAAHRAGIVHRDLKPGNIMLVGRGPSSDVRRGGPERGPHRASLRGGVQDPPTAKLLDFGLAKIAAPAVVTGSMAPTTPPAMTAQGAILGTFQYMAPEQIEGLEADARTDIFAFGAVLFEMLTGRPAFVGKTSASLLGAILKDEPPPVSTLRSGVPPAINRIVATCLAKEPDDRWQTARDLLRELKWVADGTLGESAAASAASQGRQAASAEGGMWRRVLPWAVAGVCGVTLAAVLALWTPWRAAQAPNPVRFGIVLPASQPLVAGGTDRQLAVSPDGTRLVYVARMGTGPQTQLMIRALDRLEAEPLRGISITNAFSPFFSPDGRWIGFFEGGGGGAQSELKKVSTTGGPPIVLCRFRGGLRSASWLPDDTIVFATTEEGTGLMSVPAGGGDPKVLTKPDTARGETDHWFPSVLPGGRAVLFTIVAGDISDAQVAVLDLVTGEQKVLVRGGSSAEYVETGHLVYAAAGSLRAVRFDPVRLEVLSDPVPVVEEVEIAGTGAANFSVSRTGALVYMPSGALGALAAPRSLVWVTRRGREEPVTAPARAYFALRVSPDGTRAALDIRDQENDIWVWDFARQTLTRLTFDRGQDIFPVWTPDGRRIVFRRVGTNALLLRAADGTGTEEPLHTGGIAMSFSPDGRNLVLSQDGDLRLLPLDGKRQSSLLVESMFSEGLAEVSPYGRWLAYQSNDSGQNQIYVRPFPDVASGRWQVSPGGGTHPVWARNGRELFYRDGAGALTTVPIQTQPAFSAGNPTKLFETPYFSAINARSYDVSPDGQRFLFIKDLPAPAESATSTRASIVVVLNWFEELKARLPSN